VLHGDAAAGRLRGFLSSEGTKCSHAQCAAAAFPAHLRGGAPRLLPQLVEVAVVLPQHDLGVVHEVRGGTLVCRRCTHAGRQAGRTACGGNVVRKQLALSMRRLS
jgi:hypothetical protein